MKEISPEKGLSDPIISGGLDENTEGVATPVDLQTMIFDLTSMQTVALMRIYDVLMCHYAEINPEDAKALKELHESGVVRSTIPFMENIEENNEA